MTKYQKVFIGFTLSLLVFGFAGVKTAKAITVEEIRAQIVIILAKVAEIQRQLNELISSENAPAVKSIALISPVGGEKWETGKTYEISWNTSGYSADSKVKIDILDDREAESATDYELSIAETNNTGSYLWKIPDSLGGSGLYGSLYKIIVYIGEGADKKSDKTDTYFAISAAIPSYLNVISPKGGEIWQIGKTYTIKWDSLGMDNFKMDIVLKNFEVESLVIASQIANSNYYNWQIPPNIYGTGYKISIKAYDSYGNPAALSSSNNNFTVVQAVSSENMEQQLAAVAKAVIDLLEKAKTFIAR